MMESYENFIQSKSAAVKPSGFKVDPDDLHPALFPFQKAIVARSLHQGKFCNGCDTGLGKSLMSMAWAQKVSEYTGHPTLILAPLAVAHQFEREGEKFSIPVKFASCNDDVSGNSVFVTNYEKLHRFSTDGLNVVLDESSILKAFDGKTSQSIINKFKFADFKLAASATFSPNSLTELGMQCEFLGVMTQVEMQSEYFVHDGGNTSKWRLKKWGEQSEFWEWLSSWCCLVRKPSDVGLFDDRDYILPSLNEIDHPIDSRVKEPDGLLPGCWVPSGSSADKRYINKSSIHDRCEYAAELVNSNDDQWVVWCNTNDESNALSKLIHDSVEVAGRHSDEHKVQTIKGFQEGNIRVIVTKDKIFGFGINLQNCWNSVLFPNDSYEKCYQLIRRFYRFGQKNDVNIHKVYHRLEGYSTMPNLLRKAAISDKMFSEMLPFQKQRFSGLGYNTSRMVNDYMPTHLMTVPDWLFSDN